MDYFELTKWCLLSGQKVESVEDVLCKSAKMMRRWKVLLKPDKLMELERLIEALEKRGAGPARIAWSSSTSSSLGASRSPRHRSAFRDAQGGESQEAEHVSVRNATDLVLSCVRGCSVFESITSPRLEREEPLG